jgi:1-acyl-sn-glycerol-3-phosphate acyltransferase
MAFLRIFSTRLYSPLRIWLVSLSFGLLTTLVVILLPGRERRRRMAHWAGVQLFRLAGLPLRTRGLNHLPADACIVAANHASYLDGVILTAALPPRFSFVIKHEMAATPLLGWLLTRLGSEFVQRFDKKAAHSAANRLIQLARGGACLGVFPEGTFKLEPGLRPFHLGAFLTATRAGLPVVPVVIRGTRQVLPAHSWWPRPGSIDIEILPPVFPRGRTGDTARKLRENVRAYILAACGEPDAGEPHPEEARAQRS